MLICTPSTCILLIQTTQALGNSTYYFNHLTGQDYLDAAVATNGTMGDLYWNALWWRQSRARAAIEMGMAYTYPNGKIVELDG